MNVENELEEAVAALGGGYQPAPSSPEDAFEVPPATTPADDS